MSASLTIRFKWFLLADDSSYLLVTELTDGYSYWCHQQGVKVFGSSLKSPHYLLSERSIDHEVTKSIYKVSDLTS